jgi:hypothetical protein
VRWSGCAGRTGSDSTARPVDGEAQHRCALCVIVLLTVPSGLATAGTAGTRPARRLGAVWLSVYSEERRRVWPKAHMRRRRALRFMKALCMSVSEGD